MAPALVRQTMMMRLHSADLKVGGLIVLMLFLRQLPASDCVDLFDTLAKRLFPPLTGQTSNFSRLRYLLRSWYRDGCHDANALEVCLKENLGSTTRLFGHVRSLIATKVGVTAATIDKGFPVLLTNYNGSGKCDKNCGEQTNVLFPIHAERTVRLQAHPA